ncbi:MAG TPA: hypothetical protein VEX38_02025 [Fimbriimonadaceae bacterium]|nr:hypothetical protein [Fimbriimonadaceae bacterium]
MDYRVTPRFTAGVEYHPAVGEILPRATWFVTPQTDRLPSVVLGATSDRLSTPRGQAYFATFSKSFKGSPVVPFVSIKYGSDEGRLAFPFGANLVVSERLTLQGLYDGNYSHGLVTYRFADVNVSFVLARMKHPGLSLSFGF